jgi:hypothetical protein
MSDANQPTNDSPGTASVPPVKAGAIVRSNAAAKPKGSGVRVWGKDPKTGERSELTGGK